ncbi:WG repeat-containing protein [Exiguobacterium sp. SH0S1]|uniref:WG repeat-containing protein n=1 Tax=Exiguobacterium sp. SH0S1 TaxID=2510949 RepID=UPI00103DD077|nr:WG repeat-containing protein [Exiguobacterium sp. SH0S1]TCI77814.1 WG repeat-containing protein [Exiguobacterium sp. SH0S1]
MKKQWLGPILCLLILLTYAPSAHANAATATSMIPWYDGYFVLNSDQTVDRFTITSALTPPKRVRLPFTGVRHIDSDGGTLHLLQNDRVVVIDTSSLQRKYDDLPMQNATAVAGNALYQIVLHKDRSLSIYDRRMNEKLDLSLTNVTQIAVRNWGIYAVRTDGTLWSAAIRWDETPQFTKHSIDQVKHVRVNSIGTWVIKQDGTLWSIGSPYPGSKQKRSDETFLKVPTLSNVIDVAVNDYRVTALTSNGSVWRWGLIGEDITEVPERLDLPPVKRLTSNEEHTVAVTTASDTLHWTEPFLRVFSEKKNGLLPIKLPAVLYQPLFLDAGMPTEGKMFVSTRDQKRQVLNQDGQKLFDVSGDSCPGRIGSFTHGLLEVCFKSSQGFKIGLSDAKGKTIVPPRYPDLTVASPTLITFKSPTNYRWGLMDRNQKIIFPAVSTIPIEFNKERVALVKSESSRYGYINLAGKWIVKPTYEHAYPFGSGHAFVSVKEKYGIINERGQVVVSPRYPYVSDQEVGNPTPSFTNNLALVYVNNKTRIIDTKGREHKASVALNKQNYDIAGAFQNGRILILKNGKYGYADGNGKVIISPRYDNASDFNQYRAKVMVESKGKDYWRLINLTGKTVGNTNYAYIGVIQSAATPFEDQNGQWGYLGLNGKPFVPAVYDYAMPLESGIGLIEKNELYGYIKIR